MKIKREVCLCVKKYVVCLSSSVWLVLVMCSLRAAMARS